MSRQRCGRGGTDRRCNDSTSSNQCPATTTHSQQCMNVSSYGCDTNCSCPTAPSAVPETKSAAPRTVCMHTTTRKAELTKKADRADP